MVNAHEAKMVADGINQAKRTKSRLEAEAFIEDVISPIVQKAMNEGEYRVFITLNSLEECTVKFVANILQTYGYTLSCFQDEWILSWK